MDGGVKIFLAYLITTCTADGICKVSSFFVNLHSSTWLVCQEIRETSLVLFKLSRGEDQLLELATASLEALNYPSPSMKILTCPSITLAGVPCYSTQVSTQDIRRLKEPVFSSCHLLVSSIINNLISRENGRVMMHHVQITRVCSG